MQLGQAIAQIRKERGLTQEAFAKTQELGKVTFYSRSKNRLWTKGEESGNFLEVKNIAIDCDSDTILVKAKPYGPTCHTGSTTCFKEETNHGINSEKVKIRTQMM